MGAGKWTSGYVVLTGRGSADAARFEAGYGLLILGWVCLRSVWWCELGCGLGLCSKIRMGYVPC